MKKNHFFYPIIALVLSCVQLYAQVSYPGEETVIYYDPATVGTSQVPPLPPSAVPRSSDFIVDYIGNWPPDAMAAFDYAVSIWEHHLTSSVPISVEARYEPLATSPGLVLGSARARSYWVNSSPGYPFPKDGRAYPDALANKIAEEDFNPSEPEILARFTTDAALSTQGLSWNFDQNHPPDLTQIDFVTVALHELGHGIMGTTSAEVSETGLGSLASNLGGNPTILDEFVSLCTDPNSPIPIVNMPNNSTILGNALTSGNLCFLDMFGNAPCTAGGNPPKLYAPDPWTGASSVVHLDEATYPSGDVNSLMTPFAGDGEQIHQVGDLFLCILEQLGWMVDYTTGIEDDIAITSWPSLIGEGQNFDFSAVFYDEEPYGDYIINNTHEWKVEPLYSQGFHPLLVTQSTVKWEYWPDQLPYLPFIVNNRWSRNPDGSVRAKATISAEDNDGIFHSESVDIGIPYAPDRPVIQSDYLGCYEVKLSFYSPGTTSFEIYYDTDPGLPYNGTGLPQGNSPITVNGSNSSIVLTNLAPNQTYYFNVRGVNSTGYSTYALEEYELIPIEEGDCGGTVFINECVTEWGAILDVSEVNMDENEAVFVYLSDGANTSKYQGVLNSASLDLANLDEVLTQMAGSSTVQISDGGYYTAMFNYPKNGFFNLQKSNFEVSNSLICDRSSMRQKENKDDNVVLFEIMPNPAKSNTNFTIGFDDEFTQFEIRVLNQYGVVIKDFNLKENSSIDFDTSELPSGIYFIQLRSENEILANERLIITR